VRRQSKPIARRAKRRRHRADKSNPSRRRSSRNPINIRRPHPWFGGSINRNKPPQLRLDPLPHFHLGNKRVSPPVLRPTSRDRPYLLRANSRFLPHVHQSRI